METIKFEIHYRWHKLKHFFKEEIPFFIARKLIPRRICYYVVIRVWAYATAVVHTDKSPDQVTWSDALKSEKEF